jgi:hypothetical protein
MNRRLAPAASGVILERTAAQAAQAFLRFMTSPAVKARFAKSGFEVAL